MESEHWGPDDQKHVKIDQQKFVDLTLGHTFFPMYTCVMLNVIDMPAIDSSFSSCYHGWWSYTIMTLLVSINPRSTAFSHDECATLA